MATNPFFTDKARLPVNKLLQLTQKQMINSPHLICLKNIDC